MSAVIDREPSGRRTEAPPSRLRVLVLHNAYREAGGEDAVVEAEAALLAGAGHHVVVWQRRNDEIVDGEGRLGLAIGTVWSARSHADVRALMSAHRPDVVHVHNTLPLLSPSVLWAASRSAAVVQTVHNHRHSCPRGTLLRDDRPCVRCVGRLPLPAVVHRCYRDSRAQTMAVAAMLVAHRAIGTWRTQVHRYIAPSDATARRLEAAGVPADRVRVKPHFVADPGPAGRRAVDAPCFVYVGRLAREKGIDVLAAAMATAGPAVSLVAVGSGPLRDRLAGIDGIRLTGRLEGGDLRAAMAGALAVVVPSLAEETFGRVVIEAYALGVAVIASRVGALADLVEDGRTGVLVEAGDAGRLAAALRWAAEHPEAMAAMGRRARARYLERYTPATNLAELDAIYRQAIDAWRLAS